MHGMIEEGVVQRLHHNRLNDENITTPAAESESMFSRMRGSAVVKR